MRLNKLAAFSCLFLALVFAGAVTADTFSAGQFVTHDQGDWGFGGAETSLLVADFNSVYAAENDVLSVGVVGTSGEFYLAFTGANGVGYYVPTGGLAGPLTMSLTNPTETSSGVFGGDVVVLDLNIAFNQAGDLSGTSSTLFGNLVLANFTGSLSGLDGLTVSQFLNDVADPCLAGGACPYGLGNVASITDDLGTAFEGGYPMTFAEDYLALPSSGTPTPTPEPSSVLLLGPGLVGLGLLRRRFKSEDAHALE